MPETRDYTNFTWVHFYAGNIGKEVAYNLLLTASTFVSPSCRLPTKESYVSSRRTLAKPTPGVHVCSQSNRTELIPESKKFPFRFLALVAIPCPANPSYELRPPKISGVFRKINGPDFWLADSSEKKIVEDRYRGDFESGEDERNSLEMGPTPTGYIFI
ncbi:unnamed protein product [Prunus armeniaca]|uniref:Uncharacterized protein n=1 Tax=Prunus armeniaca TaxID=36596 RepID=A0A6J5W6F8_PRUAR|nr:unnamed protein product [Prunus armeniaca]